MRNSFSYLTLSMLCFAGCANPYKSNFTSTIEKFPPTLQAKILPNKGEPKLYTTEDIRKDSRALLENGFLMLGLSKFNAPVVDVGQALAVGKNHGAAIVMVEKKFSRTATETVPYTVWNQDQVTTIRDNGTAYGGRHNQAYNRDTEIRTEGTYETVFVPTQTDYYDQAATFWAKTSPQTFGAYVKEISDEQRQQLQTNRALVIKIVVKGSPAFNADLFPEDIILKLDGNPVSDATSFSQTIEENTGKVITLSTLRNNQPRDVTLKLN